jgi:hypothetical protein
MTLTDSPAGHCLGSALEVCSIILKGIGGVILAFVHGPAVHGPRAAIGRPKSDFSSEIPLLKPPALPWASFWKSIAIKLSNVSSSLHLFVMDSPFSDLSVLSVPVNLTGGRCYLYRSLSPSIHTDISKTLTMRYFLNSSIRIKLGAGLNMRRMHGNGVLKERDLIIMPALAVSETYAFEFDFQHVVELGVLQFVLEWCENRKRVVRVCTVAFPVSPNFTDVLCGADEGALTAVLVKRILQNMIGFGTNEASARFQAESSVFSAFKCVPQFAFGLLHTEFLRDCRTDWKIARMMQLRSGTVIDILLYCYPRLICVEDGGLRMLVKGSFRDGVMVLHTVDAILLWAPSERVLMQEVGGAMSEQGLVDLELLRGGRADAIRSIVRSEWELSFSYVTVLGIFGEDVIKPYLVEDRRGDVKTFSIWACHGRFVPPEDQIAE